MANTIRLQVDILEHQLEKLEELQRLGGLRSKRELWDTAFTLLKWATRKKAQGYSIGSMSEEGAYTELEMPFLEHYLASVEKRNAEENPAQANDEPMETGMKATELSLHSSTRNGGVKMGLSKKRQTA